MAKKNTQQPQEQFKTMIGGQALIEGIMMLGPEKSAVVVRTKDGLQRKVEPRKLSQKWSPTVWKSTVMQYGVPISSSRR